MEEEVDGLKKQVIDPLCEVEDRLSLNPQHPFGLLNNRTDIFPSIIYPMRLQATAQ
jgi:hypothetical protein